MNPLTSVLPSPPLLTHPPVRIRWRASRSAAQIGRCARRRDPDLVFFTDPDVWRASRSRVPPPTPPIQSNPIQSNQCPLPSSVASPSTSSSSAASPPSPSLTLLPAPTQHPIIILHPHAPPPSRTSSLTFTTDPFDPSTLLKEDPISLSASLWLSSFRHPSTTPNLSAYLSRLELWLLAYKKAHADDTGSYLPRSNVSLPTIHQLLSLRNAVIDGRFKWGNRLTPFIRSPRETDPATLSKRKLKALLATPGPPPFQDRILHEVLLLILEPVFESRFSSKSFAFRPGRTAHSAIRTIQRSFFWVSLVSQGGLEHTF